MKLRTRGSRRAAPVAAAVLLAAAARADTLRVGPGQRFERIEEANARAKPGDVIEVFPRDGDRPYERVAVQVRVPALTFRAAAREEGKRVAVSGVGFDYSGVSSVPRAIFQFSRGADGSTLEGFELSGARKGSQNGAGVRVVEANHVTIRDCEVHGNDMGIMSSGDGTARSAVDQRIERCVIHENGSAEKRGESHNLYLGGASVTLSCCEVHHSTVGHNVKSRAHHTRVEYSYIHDSANRELSRLSSGALAAPHRGPRTAIVAFVDQGEFGLNGEASSA